MEKIDRINPYVGPFSFSSQDENRFFGRKKETEELVSLISNSSLTIIFGTSGIGKTSLIHAKLLPQLRREYFHPIYIRINFESADPLNVTRKKIVEELRKWQPDLPDFYDGQTLIDYAANTDIFKGLVKPVLFFDQFEELFTLGPQNDPLKIKNFILELSDLIESRLPDYLKKSENIHNISNFKVVFSLRQDWIAYLEDYSYIIPSVLENRYRLKKFSSSQAEDAIYLPAKNIIDLETADTIIKLIGEKALFEEEDIRGFIVDPFILSLYCYELYEKLSETADIYITKTLVNSHSPKELIREYYDTKTQNYDIIKQLIEDRLVNESGKRLMVPFNKLTAGNLELKNTIKKFIKETGIIRMIGEELNCEIEIVHDQLAIEIFQSRNKRIAKTLTEEAFKKEAEAEVLKQSAQKAKKNTFRIGVIATIIILLLICFSIKIYVDFKNDHTLIGLQDQLGNERKAHQMAIESIKVLGDSLTKVNASKMLVPSEIPNTNQQVAKRYNDSLKSQKDSIASLVQENNSLIASVKDRNEEILNKSKEQLKTLELLRRAQQAPNSTDITDMLPPKATTFLPADLSNLQITNQLNPDKISYDFHNIKNKGFQFQFDINANTAGKDGYIEIRVFTNVYRSTGNYVANFRKVGILQALPQPTLLVDAPKGIKPEPATYEINYFEIKNTTRTNPILLKKVTF